MSDVQASIPFGCSRGTRAHATRPYAIRPYEDPGHGVGSGVKDVEHMPAAGERRPVWLSKHALARAARRNVVPDAVEYVLAYGRMVQRTGITFFFLGRRDIPPADRRTAWAARLVGTVVLLASDGEVVTVYRNQRALRAIRRKLKYRLTPEQCPAMRVLDEVRRSA